MALEAGKKCLCIPDGRGGYTAYEISAPAVGEKCILLPDGKGGYIAVGTSAPAVGDKVPVVPDGRGGYVTWSSGVPNWYNTVSGLFTHTYFGMGMVFYDDKYWMIGGVYNNPYGEPNIVYSSDDGITWTEVTNSANIGDHGYTTATVFDNKMWCFGVKTSYSTNGVDWVQTSNSPLGARTAVVVFDDKMWMIGGNYNYNRSTRVYSSSDGITWDLETSTPGWSARTSHSCITYNDQIWLTGGSVINDTYTSSEVWATEDGVNWALITDSPGWAPRLGHAFVVYKNKMYVAGGITNTTLTPYPIPDDLWHSSDGLNWTETNPETKYEKSYSFGYCSSNKMIVLAAGISSDGVWAYY